MLATKPRLFPRSQALSDVGRATLPDIGLLLPQLDGFPPTWGLHLVPTVDAHLFWLPGVATHGQRAIGADELDCPVLALRRVDEARLNYRVHRVSMIQEQRRVVIGFNPTVFAIGEPPPDRASTPRPPP